MLDTYKLTSRAGILRTQLIHDHTSYTESFKYLRLSKDKRIYKNKRIILLIRNIKDIMVSYYFYVTRRDHDYNGNISDFIRSSKFGAKNIINFYNTWYESRKIPLDFMLLRYEDMIHNTGECLINTMKFLGLENIDENDVREAIEFASFNNLKKLEREEYFSQSSMRPGNKSDNESYTIRKGEVKGYSSYLSESDIDYIDTLIQELGCPFA